MANVDKINELLDGSDIEIDELNNMFNVFNFFDMFKNDNNLEVFDLGIANEILKLKHDHPELLNIDNKIIDSLK